MIELECLINKYGNTLTTENLAEIYKVDVKTVRNLINKDINYPRLKGFKNILVNTTNWYLYTLANNDVCEYDYLKQMMIREGKNYEEINSNKRVAVTTAQYN